VTAGTPPSASTSTSRATSSTTAPATSSRTAAARPAQTETVDAIRAAGREGRPAQRRGLWVSYLTPYALEIALSGFAGDDAGRGPDWLGIDLQHGAVEVSEVPGLLRVSERHGIPVLTRMPSHDKAAIGRVVDAGVDGVIVPSVESAAQAQALVEAVRLPPGGSRSTGAARSSFGVTSGTEPLLLPMVETRAGRDHAAEIAAVEGVDGIFLGPYDLSVSLGLASPVVPEALDVLRSVIEVGRAAHVAVGLYAGLDELRDLTPLLDLVGVDSDIAALRLGLRAMFG
jgi:4-hydroxy-2-oxoheptanedioate aldolase